MAAGMTSRALLFPASYEERVELVDGTEVELRLLRPGDGPSLRSGLARMSPESRYARFMGERRDLNEDELRYLCQIDVFDHFAICAVSVEIELQAARIVPPSPAGIEAGHPVLHPPGRRS
jgi:hypothetical protein